MYLLLNSLKGFDELCKIVLFEVNESANKYIVFLQCVPNDKLHRWLVLDKYTNILSRAGKYGRNQCHNINKIAKLYRKYSNGCLMQ